MYCLVEYINLPTRFVVNSLVTPEVYTVCSNFINLIYSVLGIVYNEHGRMYDTRRDCKCNSGLYHNYCKPGLELRKFIELLYVLTMQSDSLHT